MKSVVVFISFDYEDRPSHLMGSQEPPQPSLFFVLDTWTDQVLPKHLVRITQGGTAQGFRAIVANFNTRA